MISFGEVPQDKSSKKRAVVLTADRFEDMELYIPVYRLLEEGWPMDIPAFTREMMKIARRGETV